MLVLMRARRIGALLALAVFTVPAFLVVFIPSVQSAGAATTIDVPASIDATGARDVAVDLTRFFASVPAGATVEFPANATYRIDGVLRLTKLHDVTIDGHGSRLVAPTDGHEVTPPTPVFRPHWPRLREHVAIHGSSGLVIRDLAIRGPNAAGRYEVALEGQAGFVVAASSNVLLQDVSVSDTYGDGVYVAGKANDVRVVDGNFDKIGRQGIAIVNGSNVVVQGSHFRDVARSVIDVEPTVPQWTVSGVHVKGNEIGDYGNFALAAGGSGANVSDVWFEDNHVTGGNGIAVFAGAPHAVRHGLHLVGNTSDVAGKVVTGTGEVGVIQIMRIDGVQIVGNRQQISAGSVAVSLNAACDVDMHDNSFSGASHDQEVVAPCGAKAGPQKAGSQKSAPSSGAARLHPSKSNPWITAGAALGALVLVLVLVRVLRRGPEVPE